MSTWYIKTKEVSAALVAITSERSGLPITQTTEHATLEKIIDWFSR